MEAEENKKNDVRAKLEAAIEKAEEVCARLKEGTAAAAKAADKAVHEHPYPALGIAFGAGVLIGLLVSRTRRN